MIRGTIQVAKIVVAINDVHVSEIEIAHVNVGQRSTIIMIDWFPFFAQG